MAITSSMLGVCVPECDVALDFACFADVTALYSADTPSSISLSRSNCAALHLDRLLEAHRAENLYYLREPVATLDPSTIPAAIQALERLFEQIRESPDRALACAFRECTAEQLVAAASAPEVTPAQDDPEDEEGEGLPHVIGYLKAHAVVLRHALQLGLRVAHGHSHDLDGTET